MMAGIWDVMFGKPQAWYTNLSSVQDRLVVAKTGIYEIGKDIWNTISDAYKVAMGGPQYFSGFEWATEEINKRLKAILVTENYVPSDGEISLASQRASEFQSMVEYAKRILPEIRGKVESEQAKMEADLKKITMLSPADVGQQAFWDELKRRAALMGGVGIGIIALVLGGVFILSRILK